jgi:hypothetical protein
MPKNEVSDPITDQEIAFARLVLSRAMTDRHAAAQQQPIQQEADLSRQSGRAAEGLHCLNPDREQVLTRLWEIANLSPEATRGSLTGQVKALSMIVAMQNFIPDRRAVSSEKKSAPATNTQPQTYPAASRRQQATTPATTNDPQRSPTPAQQEDSPGAPACPASPGVPRSVPWKPEPGSEAPEPYVPLFASVPDLRVGFSIKNPFVHPR